MNVKLKEVLKSIGCVVISMVTTKILSEVVGPYSKNMYANSCIGELVLAVFSIISLIFLKRMYVLKFKAEGFKEGILTGGIIVVIGISVIAGVAGYMGMPITASPFEIMVFVIHMLLVGIAEEVLFRGILQKSILEYMGTDSIGKVRMGIIISSVIFASVHLLNTFLPGISFTDALKQTISVIPMGVLFGTIYFRSKNNLWAVILLHAFNDFFTFLVAGYISNASLSESISGTSNNIVGTLIVFTIIDLWVMRKKKLSKLC